MRVIWSRPALDDLRGIEDWLSEHASPEVTTRTLAAIRKRADFLRDFPHGGRPHRDGQRILRVYGTRYLIRYLVEDNVVGVARVHHEREDWFPIP